MTKEYRSILQSRENYEKTKQRPIRTISLDEAPSKMVRQKQKVRKPEPVQDKMTRMPKQELITMIFACFNKQEHWNLKDLRVATEQPTVRTSSRCKRLICRLTLLLFTIGLVEGDS